MKKTYYALEITPESLFDPDTVLSFRIYAFDDKTFRDSEVKKNTNLFVMRARMAKSESRAFNVPIEDYPRFKN